MNEQKSCPLLGASPLGENTNCRGEHCAWACDGGCAINVIARSLDELNRLGITVYEG